MTAPEPTQVLPKEGRYFVVCKAPNVERGQRGILRPFEPSDSYYRANELTPFRFGERVECVVEMPAYSRNVPLAELLIDLLHKAINRTNEFGATHFSLENITLHTHLDEGNWPFVNLSPFACQFAILYAHLGMYVPNIEQLEFEF